MQLYYLKWYRIIIMLVFISFGWLLILDSERYLKNLILHKSNINDSTDLHLQHHILQKLEQTSIRELRQEKISKLNETMNIPFILILCDKGNNNSGQVKYVTTLLKSAALFTKIKLQFIIVTSSMETYNHVTDNVASWPPYYQQKLNLTHRPVWYPSNLEVKMRRVKTHISCHTEHILIPDMFQNLDAAIYVDNDVIFFRPPEDLWEEFDHFADHSMVGMVPCRTNSSKQLKFKCWNGGLILFNLTRLSTFPGGWTNANMEVIKNLSYMWGNQDIFNSLFKKNTICLHEVSCEWNYRRTQCQRGFNECYQAAFRGISSLHGNAGTFHVDPLMKVMYSALQKYNLHTSSLTETIYGLEKKVKVIINEGNPKHKCGNSTEIETVFLQRLRNHLTTLT